MQFRHLLYLILTASLLGLGGCATTSTTPDHDPSTHTHPAGNNHHVTQDAGEQASCCGGCTKPKTEEKKEGCAKTKAAEEAKAKAEAEKKKADGPRAKAKAEAEAKAKAEAEEEKGSCCGGCGG